MCALVHKLKAQLKMFRDEKDSRLLCGSISAGEKYFVTLSRRKLLHQEMATQKISFPSPKNI
jgi:hypothetical protein